MLLLLLCLIYLKIFVRFIWIVFLFLRNPTRKKTPNTSHRNQMKRLWMTCFFPTKILKDRRRISQITTKTNYVYIYTERNCELPTCPLFFASRKILDRRNTRWIYIYKTGYTYEMHIWCRFVYPIDLYQSAFFSQTLSVNSFVF